MSTEDAGYLLARAEEELESAQRATHPEVVKVHYTMAGLYLDRAYGPGDDEPDRSNVEVAESSGCKKVEGEQVGRIGAVERAFQLARSGECRSVNEIRKQLLREQWEQVEMHLSGKLIRAQLQKVLKA